LVSLNYFLSSTEIFVYVTFAGMLITPSFLYYKFCEPMVCAIRPHRSLHMCFWLVFLQLFIFWRIQLQLCAPPSPRSIRPTPTSPALPTTQKWATIVSTVTFMYA